VVEWHITYVVGVWWHRAEVLIPSIAEQLLARLCQLRTCSMFEGIRRREEVVYPL